MVAGRTPGTTGLSLRSRSGGRDTSAPPREETVGRSSTICVGLFRTYDSPVKLSVRTGNCSLARDPRCSPRGHAVSIRNGSDGLRWRSNVPRIVRPTRGPAGMERPRNEGHSTERIALPRRHRRLVHGRVAKPVSGRGRSVGTPRYRPSDWLRCDRGARLWARETAGIRRVNALTVCALRVRRCSRPAPSPVVGQMREWM